MSTARKNRRNGMRRANGAGGIYRRKKNGTPIGCWLIKYYVGDKVYYESSGLTVKKAAQDLLDERRRQAKTGELDARKVTLERLEQLIVDDYRLKQRKSLARVFQCLKHLRRHLGRIAVTGITVQAGRDYCARRQEEGAAANTIKNEMATLSRMFTLAYKAELVPRRPPFDMPEVRNVRSGFVSEAELRRIMENLPAYMQPFVLFLFYTGWRRGEAIPLRWAQVDFSAKVVRLEPGTTKNDRGRELPFARMPQLEALLLERWEATQVLQPHGGNRPVGVFPG